MWIAVNDLPVTGGHPFYRRLNQVLETHGFDVFVETQCAPFYAATVYPVWHDSYGGLRINGRAQVIDMQGEAIPGLYAGGESSGGGMQHGLGRALVHGYIAGTNAAKELTATL